MAGRTKRAYCSLLWVFLIAIGWGLCIAPGWQLLVRVFCRQHAAEQQGVPFGQVAPPSVEYCREHGVHKVISLNMLHLSLFQSIPFLIVTAIYGRLSDNPRFGRKPFVALPIIGELVAATTFLLVEFFALPPWYLKLGYFIMGWMGGSGTFWAAYYAYLTDNVPKNRTTFFYVLVEGPLFLGLSIGPLIMSSLSTAAPDWPILPVAVAWGVFALNLVAVYLIPESSRGSSSGYESLTAPEHGAAQSRLAAIRGVGVYLWNVLVGIQELWTPWNWTRSMFMIAFFFGELARGDEMVMLVPYTFRMFGWTQKDDGYYQFVNSIAKVVAVVVFLVMLWYGQRKERRDQPVISQATTVAEIGPNNSGSDGNKLSAHGRPNNNESLLILDPAHRKENSLSPENGTGLTLEARLVVLCYVVYAAVYVVFGATRDPNVFLGVSPVAAIGILCLSGHRTIMIRTVPGHMVGTLLAMLSILRSVGWMLAPVVFNGVYAVTVGHVDGAVFFVGASMWAVAALLCLVLRKRDLVADRAAEAAQNYGGEAKEAVSV